MKGMQHLVKQAQKMQKQMMQAQEELEGLEVEGGAGGGMVTVKVNGKGDILSLKIDPEAVDPDDVEMLEDTILAAIQDAVEKSRKVAEEKMMKASGGMGAMGGMGLPGF
ncbi:MAG: YbaB/EbfC family nucleoid-associated protein [FCB group bacterium]|nr:YbaB/EbfC family nucleoid-associated protein [FCB group bacterium]